jgi:hypothetical protein
MEPSLRSSTQRGTECKLRKTDPAAHETTKRFVESLRNDVRISQYADMNFATKKFEDSKEPWYWLEPVPGGRTGFLVFLPDQPAVWMDDQGKGSMFVQMRVSVDTYQKNSVFIASLNKFDGLLRLEDAWLISGKKYVATPFTQRWNDVLDFYSTQYKEDHQLQQGLRIEPAEFKSLGSIRDWHSSAPSMMFAQGERYPRRLRVQLAETQAQPKTQDNTQQRPLTQAQPRPQPQPQAQPRPQPQAQKRPPIVPLFVDDEEVSDTKKTMNENIALAVAHEEYPDTYNLSVNGVKKGYAAVQDLELSRELRSATKENANVYVKIEWNTEFSMYEIISFAKVE